MNAVTLDRQESEALQRVLGNPQYKFRADNGVRGRPLVEENDMVVISFLQRRINKYLEDLQGQQEKEK